ncbi:hypothetical protein ACQY0O_008271 [Thecaphora frezii]
MGGNASDSYSHYQDRMGTGVGSAPDPRLDPSMASGSFPARAAQPEQPYSLPRIDAEAGDRRSVHSQFAVASGIAASTPPASAATGSSRASTAAAKRPRDESPPQAAEEVPKKKAPKKAVSCEACRRRKLKCDRGWPCGACRDRGESSLCEWADGVKPQSAGRDVGDPNAVSERLDRLEAMMGSIASHFGVALPGQNASRRRGAAGGEAPSARGRDGEAAPFRTGPAAASVRSPQSDETAVDRLTQLESNYYYAFEVPGIGPKDPEAFAVETLDLLLPLLYAPDLVRRVICYHFDTSIGLFVYVCEKDYFLRHLDQFERFRTDWQDRGSQAYSHQTIKEAVRFLALVLACCASTIVLESSPAHPLPELTRGRPTHLLYMAAAQHALRAANIYDDPDTMNVRTLLMLQPCVTLSKGASLGRLYMTTLFSLVAYMNLDVEPAGDLPEPVKKDRVRLFASVCLADWTPMGIPKRTCFFDERYLNFPSLFDIAFDRHNYLWPHAKAALTIGRISVKASSRVAMQEDEAYEYTEALQAELLAAEAEWPDEVRYKGRHTLEPFFKTGASFTLWAALMVQQTLMMLHKHFYMQSWTQPKYKRSRNICFTAATKTVGFCRDLFAWYRPPDNATPEERTALIHEGMGKRKLSVAKAWHSVQMALVSSLVLVHFLSMLDLHPSETADWNMQMLRSQTSKDIKFMRELVAALSPKADVMKDTVKVLDSSKSLDKTSQVLNSEQPKQGNSRLPSPMSASWYRANMGSSTSSLLYNRGCSSHGAASATSPLSYSQPSSSEEHLRRTRHLTSMASASSARNFDDIEALWAKQPWHVSSISKSQSGTAASVTSSPSSSGRPHAASPTVAEVPVLLPPPPPPSRSPHPSFGPGSHLLNEMPTVLAHGPMTRPEVPRAEPPVAQLQAPQAWGEPRAEAHPHPHQPLHPHHSGDVGMAPPSELPLMLGDAHLGTSSPLHGDWGAAAGGAAELTSWLSDLVKVDFGRADSTLLEQLVPNNPLTNVLVESLDGYMQNLGPGASGIANPNQHKPMTHHNDLVSMAEVMRMNSYL